MNTLTKIGKAALSRLFTSGKNRANTVEFPTEEFDLTKVVRWLRVNDHCGSIQTIGGTSHYLWGIELGLQHLETEEGKTFADAIAAFLAKSENRLVFPSHIIACTWWDGDMLTNREEAYVVHRFTQEQDRMIEDLGFASQ